MPYYPIDMEFYCSSYVSIGISQTIKISQKTEAPMGMSHERRCRDSDLPWVTGFVDR